MIGITAIESTGVRFGKKLKRKSVEEVHHRVAERRAAAGSQGKTSTFTTSSTPGCRGQQPGLDEFDQEAARVGGAERRHGNRRNRSGN